MPPLANKQSDFKPDSGKMHDIKTYSINSNGFRLALVLIVITVVAIICATGYYLVKNNDSADIQALNLQNVRNNSGDILVYEADLRNITSGREKEAMEGLKEVIARRLETSGIPDPNIQIKGENRLVISLAGTKDKAHIVKIIEEAPLLEFRESVPREEYAKIYKQQTGQDLPVDAEDPFFVPTALTGKDLAKSSVDFDSATGRPTVKLQFNDEGKKLFADLTTKNVGKPIAIYLDGSPITAPRVNESITDGNAIITGDFTLDEARTLVIRLNAGALPVPIKLISE